MDRYLDTTREGPHYLRIPEVAQAVVGAIHFAEERLDFYRIDSYVVMSNHVHLMLEPQAPASQFLKSVKNYSAREANRILDRTGAAFWQSESYDRWVRTAEERDRIRRYIHQNPVKAGLVGQAEDYRWSTAWRVD
jgi:REP element-mobilizing transposase RayT